LKGAGYSHNVLQQLSRARVASTNTTYESKWRLFEAFAQSQGFDAFRATPAQVAEFLVHIAQSRSSACSTIAGYRAAIGNVLKLTVGYDPG
jgi:hypothetical protein